jgi:hypothetical protein
MKKRKKFGNSLVNTSSLKDVKLLIRNSNLYLGNKIRKKSVNNFVNTNLKFYWPIGKRKEEAEMERDGSYFGSASLGQLTLCRQTFDRLLPRTGKL